MTSIVMPGKKVARITGAAHKGRNIVVEVSAQMLTFRLKVALHSGSVRASRQDSGLPRGEGA